jgi:GNAT superfamily N-acetyltransferase
MENNLIIRLATEEDSKAVIKLWREMADLHQKIEPLVWTLQPGANNLAQRYFADCRNTEDHLCLVAVAQEEIVGFLHAAKTGRPPVFLFATTGKVIECCVSETQRRQGVGQQLLAEALKWFKARGINHIEVSYALDNPGAEAFWSEQGFRPYQAKAILTS